jgi:hypothetical protein
LVNYSTRHCWTYGLKTKTAESLIDALWSFFIDTGGIPTRIRCDFDASFVKGKVTAFLKQHRIKVTSAPPKHQSQNGLVERYWQTTVAIAWALLVEAQLPRRYWFWALRKAYIRMNMMPCRYQKQTEGASASIPDNGGTGPTGLPEDSPSVDDPTTGPKLTTPFERFDGERPDYRNLFKWGSVGYFIVAWPTPASSVGISTSKAALALPSAKAITPTG